MKCNQGTAIIYFSRHAAVEGQHKSWFKNKASQKNTLLAKVLIDQSFDSIKNLDLPVFHYHEGNQKGNSFGEKLANAYADVFALGFESVISLGNDTPEIARIDWTKIKNELAQGRCVIGASQSGGAYLIGLTFESFDQISFQNLPWKSDKLFQNLVAFCQAFHMMPLTLQPLRDINVYQDLVRWLHESNLFPLRRLILEIIKMGNVVKSQNLGWIRQLIFVDLQLPCRAPPIY